MLLGHGGARGSDGFFDAGLVRRNNIHVAFDDDDEPASSNGFFGLIETENES